MGHHRLRNWVLRQVTIYVAAISLLLILGASLNLLPVGIKEMLSWGSSNFLLLCVLFMFSLGCYVILRVSGRSRGSGR